MSREVRRVPADWQHPTKAALGRGGKWRPFWEPIYHEDMDELIGDRERTHWQMYETVSEGTPISPPCVTPETLALWLADNKASVFGSFTGTYEQWLQMIVGSGATVGALLHPDGSMSPGWLDGQV